MFDEGRENDWTNPLSDQSDFLPTLATMLQLKASYWCVRVDFRGMTPPCG